MPRGVKISLHLKQRIIAAHREGERQSDIARRDARRGLKLKNQVSATSQCDC